MSYSQVCRSVSIWSYVVWTLYDRVTPFTKRTLAGQSTADSLKPAIVRRHSLNEMMRARTADLHHDGKADF